MASPSIKQQATPLGASSGAALTATSNALPAAPTSGNPLVVAYTVEAATAQSWTAPTGFTLVKQEDTAAANGIGMAVFAKVSDGTETGGTQASWSSSGIWEILGPYEI